jgi:histidine phosphotransfer protein HptB
MDAVLSIRSSSQVIGAEGLASLASHLEQALREALGHNDPDTALPQLATTHLQRTNECAEQTGQQLQKHLP